MLKVTYLQRRPRSSGNYSLEAVFADVRQRLGNAVAPSVHIVAAVSDGFWRRLWIVFDAWRNQGQINHITGDITFAAIVTAPDSTVLTIPDCGDWRSRSGLKAAIAKALWFKWPVRRAARVTTISMAAKADIVAITGCAEDKVDVIPVAISEQFRRSDRRPSFTEPRILQVGTSINKNLPRLIRALKGLQCQLVIVGQLDNETRRELQSSGLCWENFVNVDQAMLIRLYEESDIVAFVSTYEGFGMPIVEAQTVGRPVVTSCVSSMPEVAGDGACFVDPFDIDSIRAGFQRIMDNAEFRSEIIRCGFMNAKRFNADVIASQYLQLYESIALTAESGNTLTGRRASNRSLKSGL